METGLIKIRLGLLARQLILNVKQITRMKICKKCPKTSNDFKNERSFYNHEKLTKKKIKNALIVRSYCEQKWTSPAIEVMYMKKNKCNYCEDFFSKRSNLKRHIDGLEDNSNSGSNKVMNKYTIVPNVMKNIWTKGLSRDMRRTNMIQQELSITAHPVQNHLKFLAIKCFLMLFFE